MIYESTVTAAELVAAIKAELEIIPLPGELSLARWLGTLEQLAWSEVVRMRRAARVATEDSKIALDVIYVPEGEDPVKACDVCTVYLNGMQIMHGSAEEGFLFAPESLVWHVSGEHEITVDGANDGSVATIIYYARPKRRTGLEGKVALPDEFIELAASCLKGEAYRAANEDVLAAKWLADYNQKLDAFGNWCDRRRAGGGTV